MIDTALSSIHHYRGADDVWGTSGQPTEAQLKTIAEAGATTIINLALHGDPRYSLRDEAGAVRELGMHYVHIPVQFSAPTQEDLAAFFDAMDAHRGERVWVHCAANFRVSAFLGLYRVLRRGWQRQDAFALMHDLWDPDPVWKNFIDAALVDSLR